MAYCYECFYYPENGIFTRRMIMAVKTTAARVSAVDKNKEQIKELKAQVKALEKKLAKIKAITE